MDHWYNPQVFGTAALSYDFQRNILDTENLDNVTLVKGLVSKDSCKDIPKIHYCLLDMDIYASMKTGYEAVKDKIVEGGYLFLHDCVPENHLPLLNKWLFNEVLKEDKEMWNVMGQWPDQFLFGLERKKNVTP